MMSGVASGPRVGTVNPIFMAASPSLGIVAMTFAFLCVIISQPFRE
jgi:hypothetical protein